VAQVQRFFSLHVLLESPEAVILAFVNQVKLVAQLGIAQTRKCDLVMLSGFESEHLL
jgi:hypothetical protein